MAISGSGLSLPSYQRGRQPTRRSALFRRRISGSARDRSARQIERQIGQSGKLEDVLTEASSLLSGLSHGAGVVIAAKADMVLRHIEFVRLDATQGMAILVGQDGTVENRVVQLPPGATSSALAQASNYLANLAAGKTIAEVRAAMREQRAERVAELDELTHAVDAGLATLSRAARSRPRR